jgi:hypothetical protein
MPQAAPRAAAPKSTPANQKKPAPAMAPKQ